MEDVEVLCALNDEEGEGEPFFCALARHCSEVAQTCRVVAEEYRTVAEHGGKRPKRNREEGGSGDDASLKPHRRKRTGSSSKRASLPPGFWSVEDLEKLEEGIARWGLSSPDAIIALLPSRPPDEVRERLETLRRVRSWDGDDSEEGQATDLPGSGGPNAAGIFNAWGYSYRFNVDDVRVLYTATTALESVLSYLAGDLSFTVGEVTLSQQQLEEYNGTEIPMVAGAVTVAYNLNSTISSSDPPLVLDRTTLVYIWLGVINQWDHPAIAALNPVLYAAGKLPSATITLVYNTQGYLDITNSFMNALGRMDATFGAVFAAVQNTYEYLPLAFPSWNGTAVGYAAPSDRVAHVQGNEYSMTYMAWNDARDLDLPSISLYNRAGNYVRPSLATINSALSDYKNSSTFVVDISDGPGEQSWPLCHFMYILLSYNSSGASDCSQVDTLLRFIAWIQLNDNAGSVAEEKGFVPITSNIKKRIFDDLYKVTCKGKRSFSTAVLLGSGGSSPVYPTWANDFGSSTFKLKYQTTTDESALEEILDQNLDFAAMSTVIDLTSLGDNDLAALPVVAHAVVPAYNLPNAASQPPLVFDLQTLADIWMGRITRWNHANITRLNLVNVTLPDQDIVVVYTATDAVQTRLFTSALSASVPAFATQFGAVAQLNLTGLSGSLVTSADEMARTIASTPYSFTMWSYPDFYYTRKIQIGSIVGVSGDIVHPDATALLTALSDYYASGSPQIGALLGASAGSWPITAIGSFLLKTTSMVDCNKATALVNWFYWSQTSEAARDVASRVGMVVGSDLSVIKSRILTVLSNVTCSNVLVGQLHGCVADGMICSDHGTCEANRCSCNSSRAGTYCDLVVSSSNDTLAVVLAAVLVPSGVLLFLLIVAVLLFLIFGRRRRERNEWEIDMTELELGEQLGTGGYGQVYRGVWKGTEVAIKVIASENATKELEKSFRDEARLHRCLLCIFTIGPGSNVRVMTALRHPNVVLFMAACTKKGSMCIVMELMALGSLHDFLNNDLVPAVPFALSVKLAYQAAKGMHFLHSSGIVHRDLKSLNLLLDTKWNIKVSDFGLTKFKTEIKKSQPNQLQGSLHWTAPEILNESDGVDYTLADVYSFGIILWELATREQPYHGMRQAPPLAAIPAAIAVSVIRDNLRPQMPSNDGAMSPEFFQLIENCWHADPMIRPTFLEAMTRLASMQDDSSTRSSSSLHLPSDRGSWALQKDIALSTHSSNSSQGSSVKERGGVVGGTVVSPPDGELTILFSDITRAASLWEFNATAMKEATLLHNQLLRSLLSKYRGYEVVFIKDKVSGEGSFCMAFQQPTDALEWCMEVQQELLKVEWPEGLLDHPGAVEEWGDIDDRVIFRGLRVRMGIHLGKPRMVRDAMTRRVEYIGSVVNAAARITSVTNGGQVLMSNVVYEKICETELAREKNRLVPLGLLEMPDTADHKSTRLWELRVRGLEDRFLNGNLHYGHNNESETPVTTSEEDGGELMSEVEPMEDRMAFKEDNFLTSANLCRWVIDYKEIQLGKQVGMGSYGVVYRGRWKGVEVAVKKFMKQKLDERRMLEFRAEMAFLSELLHPSIVIFIGACVKRPNLCIVTEFAKNGSLHTILHDPSMRLPWHQRLRMLRDAALGVHYLHSLSPCIVHRDLKPANLLVDENWNVKVADFGFARIKEENATMTRCGTPCWTAPEVIRGQKYSEKADVYSFAIVMWEVLTRKYPFQGRNFMGVSLDVMEGRRPPIPGDCPIVFSKIMKKAWHDKPEKRPAMSDILATLNHLIGDDAGGVGA